MTEKPTKKKSIRITVESTQPTPTAPQQTDATGTVLVTHEAASRRRRI